MFYPSRFVAFAAFAGLIVRTGLAQTAGPPVPSPVSAGRTYVTQAVGLAASETAQVVIVNTSQPATFTTTTGTAPVSATPCTGTVSFLDAAGAAIGTPAKFSVAAGQIATVPLPYGATGATGGTRTMIRAEVRVNSTASTIFVATGAPVVPLPTFSCQLSYSLETFDTATGVTHVNLPGSSTVVPSLVLPATGR